MTRWLVGRFEAGGRASPTRLAGALTPHSCNLAEAGELAIAYSGLELPSRRTLCLLDGFIDNHADLCRELHLPPSTPPEHLLADAWGAWRETLLERLRGDFALVVWDRDQRRGILARDHLGARSLFLHDSPIGTTFACEMCHLLGALTKRPAPDDATVAHWIGGSNRPGAATFYAGVHKLKPGSMVLLEAGGMYEMSYWSPRFRTPKAGSKNDLALELRGDLSAAVSRCCSSSGTGVLMSGGLDSAAVTAIATETSEHEISTLSGVFPDHPAVDESELIGQLRSVLGVSGITAVVRPGGLLASVVASTERWHMPLLAWGDFWSLPLLSIAARSGVDVVLGGDGGDEVFGTRNYLMADEMRAGRIDRAAKLALRQPGAAYGPSVSEVVGVFASDALVGSMPRRVHKMLARITDRRNAPGWLRDDALRLILDTDDPGRWKEQDGPLWWTSVVDDLTRGIDEVGLFERHRRRAAAAGLDARHPLLDVDLVEKVLQMPPQLSFDPYRNRPLLRAALAGRLPEAVLMRPQKAWFESLIGDCITGPDAAATRSLLDSRSSELGAYVDVGAASGRLLEDDRERLEHPFRWMLQLWRLLTAECWLRWQRDPTHGALASSLALSETQIAIHHPASDSSVFQP